MPNRPAQNRSRSHQLPRWGNGKRSSSPSRLEYNAPSVSSSHCVATCRLHHPVLPSRDPWTRYIRLQPRSAREIRARWHGRWTEKTTLVACGKRRMMPGWSTHHCSRTAPPWTWINDTHRDDPTSYTRCTVAIVALSHCISTSSFLCHMSSNSISFDTVPSQQPHGQDRSSHSRCH